MDSRSRLDYALFQLTPTRTRCDLVICSGESKEKLASGLLEPFLAHLEFAKDQISKGGYSITLSASDSASWFTKSTIERFVKFVSTPKVLERFIAIESEIANIENSVHTNASQDSRSAYGLASEEYSNKSAISTYKHEFNTTSDAADEEDPKIHLHRVLETRKAVLQKEQAMVYARTLVAGFETENLTDLVCFADAFGSPRLREACLNFIELCNSKSNDGAWMDEVAAMQEYQELRINVPNRNFASEKHNDGVSDSASVSSLSHVSGHLPPYIYTYHDLPTFPVVPPYYHQNPPLPMKQNGNRDSSGSSSESGSGRYRKRRSQRVVIENINYITNGKDQDDPSKRNLDRTIEDEPESRKATTHQWDAFQNLLTNHVKNSSPDVKKHNTYEEPKSKDIFEDHFGSRESRNDVLVDDPLTVQARFSNRSSDQVKTEDVFIVSETNPIEKEKEPNDLYMVLERDTTGQLGSVTWTPEMEFENSNNKIVKVDSSEFKKLPSSDKETKITSKRLVGKGRERKGSNTDVKSKSLVGSFGKSKSDNVSRSKTTIPTGKSEKEEERRKKKMEELLTQRQKRIAERSASSAKTAKTDKPKPQVKSRDVKKPNKPVVKSSTINRLSGTTSKPQKTTPKEKDVSRSSVPLVPLKTAITGKKNVRPEKVKQLDKNTISKNANGSKKKITNLDNAKLLNGVSSKPQVKSRDVKKPNKPVVRSSTIERLSVTASKPRKTTPKEKGVSRSSVPLVPLKAAITGKKNVKPEKVKQLDNNMISKNANGLKKKITEDIVVKVHKALNPVTFSANDDISVKENPIVKVNGEISEMEISIPAVSPLQSNSRKKWGNGGTSSKALTGLRKLLFFGRRS